MFKNFPIGGTRKFQFRLSAYNVFNHPQRASDDTTNLDLTYTNGVQTNANFGLLPPDNKLRPPHRPDGLQVLLLGWDGGGRSRAGARKGAALLWLTAYGSRLTALGLGL